MKRLFISALCAGLVLSAFSADAAPRRGRAQPVDPAITAVQRLDADTAAKLDAAIAGAQRSDANKARDQYRRPKETLAFFGLRSTMTVVEIAPGGGWYTEILAPTLRDGGQLYVTASNPNTHAARRGIAAQLTKYAETPAAYDKVKITAPWLAEDQRVPPGSADMVVTFRNIHNFVENKTAEAQFKAWFEMLKPGGVLGVEEHRWPETSPLPRLPDGGMNGYLPESTVIRLAEAAGFRLDGKSEINANPKDTRDYANGVWALPPVLRGGDVDRAKYLAIGESDRMALRFVKPAAPAAP